MCFCDVTRYCGHERFNFAARWLHDLTNILRAKAHVSLMTVALLRAFGGGNRNADEKLRHWTKITDSHHADVTNVPTLASRSCHGSVAPLSRSTLMLRWWSWSCYRTKRNATEGVLEPSQHIHYPDIRVAHFCCHLDPFCDGECFINCCCVFGCVCWWLLFRESCLLVVHVRHAFADFVFHSLNATSHIPWSGVLMKYRLCLCWFFSSVAAVCIV